MEGNLFHAKKSTTSKMRTSATLANGHARPKKDTRGLSINQELNIHESI